ncbi:hypothetical protein DERF_012989 [Dermatophagoides farinae]|uniref:Uncharacterized protein n=1 Tax=Dermatophagoides farinae TaxID=6954 RepID=A0A922HNQ8_DERFA|nr:hypothetical protein DERF_012989 [Dermatophagoides farinae]
MADQGASKRRSSVTQLSRRGVSVFNNQGLCKTYTGTIPFAKVDCAILSTEMFQQFGSGKLSSPFPAFR